MSFIALATKFKVTKIEFKLIVIQIVIAVLLSGASAIAWTASYGSDQSDVSGGGSGDCKCKKGESTCKCSCSEGASSTTCDQNCKCNCNCPCTNCKGKAGCNTGGFSDEGFKGIGRAASPIVMSTIGFGLQGAVYSAIAPYKIIGMNKGYKIDLAVLFTSSIPSTTVLFLSRANKGPNKRWEGQNNWHSAWCFIVLQILLVISFFMSLHYPKVPLFRAMRNNILVLGVMTVAFGFCVQAGWAIGMAGAPTQDGDTKGKNPEMESLNTFTYTVAQVICAFMSNGYLRTYSKYEKDMDNWPTKHYTRLRSFWFWIWNASKFACKNLTKPFTTDLRVDILGKKEYLFIVHEDASLEDEEDKYIFDIPKSQKKDKYIFEVPTSRKKDRPVKSTKYRILVPH